MSLQELKQEYVKEIERLQERREQIRQNLRNYKGEEYYRACKRMQLLEQEEHEMLYALGQIAKSEYKKPPPGH